MKYLSLYLVFIFCNCKNSPVKDTTHFQVGDIQSVNIKLADSLGGINLNLPTRYDTSFTWTEYSDCGKPCNKIKYRYQPRIAKVSKETGWIQLWELTDSIEWFTVSHSGHFPFHDKLDSNFITSYHKKKRESLTQDPAIHLIKSDWVEKIADRYFSIFVIDISDSLKMNKKILAGSCIYGNIIEFNFDLISKQNDIAQKDFLEKSLSYLRSIKFDEHHNRR